MAFSLADLTTPMTRAEVEASIYQVLSTVGTTTTTWKPGAVVRAMITAVAIVIAAFSVLTSEIAKSGFLELAAGRWLTLVARYVYGVDRYDATFAAGALTLTNTSGLTYTLDPDDLVVANPSTKKLYRNTTAITLAPGAVLTVSVRAIEAGTGSTSGPGAITKLETTLLGVTCTNPMALVGLDAEEDVQLRSRCQETLGALSPMGPWDAYSFAARNAKRADGTRIGVTRTRSVKDGYGNLTLYVATATGGVLGSAEDPNTDLGAINEAVQRLAAPLCVTAHVVSAVPVSIPISYQAWAYNTSGLANTQISDLALAKLIAFMTDQPIGGAVIGVASGKVFLDAVRSAIGSARPEIFHVVTTVPSFDPELTVDQVPVLGTVTPTITQVAPSQGAS